MKRTKAKKLWETLERYVRAVKLLPEEKRDQEEIEAVANEIIVLMDTMKNKFLSFHKRRLRTIEMIRVGINTVDDCERRGNIATGAGAAGGIVGGLMSFGGVLAAPFTGGASVVVAAAGAVLAGAGTLAQVGADVTVQRFVASEISKARDVLDEDARSFNDFLKSVERYDRYREERKERLRRASSSGSGSGMDAETKMALACDVAWHVKKVKANGKNNNNGSVADVMRKRKPSEIVGVISKYGLSAAKSGAAVTEMLNLSTAAELGITLGGATSKVMSRVSGYTAAMGVALDSMRFIDSMNALATKELSAMSLRLRRVLDEIETQYDACRALMCDMCLINATTDPGSSSSDEDRTKVFDCREGVELAVKEESKRRLWDGALFDGCSWNNEFDKDPDSYWDKDSTTKRKSPGCFSWANLIRHQ